MLSHINNLVDRGIDRVDAEAIVKEIAYDAFLAGEFNITYDDEYGYDERELFRDWFARQINIKTV